jgi:hypothetical protein
MGIHIRKKNLHLATNSNIKATNLKEKKVKVQVSK